MTSNTAVVSRVRSVVEPAVTESGLVLEDVTIHPAGRRTVVRVVVDLDDDAIGGLGSDALAEVSRAVSAALDRSDPVRGAYVLEVSTPGTDRPLTTLRHFRRARTRLVTLTLTDGAQVRGRLRGAEESGLDVETPTGTLSVPLSDVLRGQVEVELDHRTEEEGA